MIYKDFTEFNNAKFLPTVCIIGSGPAGITLALQLEKKKIPCLIIEAGGFDFSEQVQDAYRGEVIGDPYFQLQDARLRYFGGSSGHWQGWCRPLDEIDFEYRKGIENSGWPIKKKDLDPYILATNDILELNKIAPDVALNKDLNEIQFQFSPPVRFAEKYQEHIKKSALIGLLINSPINDLVTCNNKIDAVNLFSNSEKKQQIKADYFCLCAGGIENSRLLLWSNYLHNGSVVPSALALGKYWMEHPVFVVGDTVHVNFTKKLNSVGYRFYAPSANFLRTHNVGNFGIRLFSGSDLSQALIKDGLCVAPNFFTSILKKKFGEKPCSSLVKLAWEQLPISTNRIELDTKKDACGIPRAKLFWKKQPLDRRTAEVATQLFGSYLAKQDLGGRLKMPDWLARGLDYPVENEEKASNHHMGGTRMSKASDTGVVDSNCKVFKVDNLFIGGSSVFPTGGHANPTYTIVQLALRLGDHIAQLELKNK